MEQAIDKLTALEKKLLGMNVLQEYTRDEVARLLSCNPRTVRRLLQDALDHLSRILLEGGLLEKLPSAMSRRESCQEGKNYKLNVSGSNECENKRDCAFDASIQSE
jgi:hypothetical protein